MTQENPSPVSRGAGPPIGAVVASMLGVVAWLVFILLYALYWSEGLDLFQNLVVTFVSLAIAAIAIGMMWMIWGYRRFGRFGDWSDWGFSSGGCGP